MSQHLINDLTDLVSRLKTDLSVMTATRDTYRLRMQHTEAELAVLKQMDESRRALATSLFANSREILKTAQSEMDRAKRAEAERDVLATVLVGELETQDGYTTGSAWAYVMELMTDARNNIEQED